MRSRGLGEKDRGGLGCNPGVGQKLYLVLQVALVLYARATIRIAYNAEAM